MAPPAGANTPPASTIGEGKKRSENDGVGHLGGGKGGDDAVRNCGGDDTGLALAIDGLALKRSGGGGGGDDVEKMMSAAVARYAQKYVSKTLRHAKHSAVLGGEDAKKAASNWALNHLKARLKHAFDDEENKTETDEMSYRCMRSAQLLRIFMREPVGTVDICSGVAIDVYLGGVAAAGVSFAASIRMKTDQGTSSNSSFYELWWELLSCVINAGFVDDAAMTALIEKKFHITCVEHLALPLPAYILKPYVRFLLHACIKRRAIAQELIENENILGLCVSTLAALVRTKSPPFPRGRARMDATMDVLKLMFSIGSSFGKEAHSNPQHEPWLTQLGMLVTEIMLMNVDVDGVFAMKIQIVNIMLYMPQTFAAFVQIHGLVRPLLDILERQVFSVAREGKPNAEGALVPILNVLSKVIVNDEQARQDAYLYVFPPSPSSDDKQPQDATKAAESTPQERRTISRVKTKGDAPGTKKKTAVGGSRGRPPRHPSLLLAQPYDICDNLRVEILLGFSVQTVRPESKAVYQKMRSRKRHWLPPHQRTHEYSRNVRCEM